MTVTAAPPPPPSEPPHSVGARVLTGIRWRVIFIGISVVGGIANTILAERVIGTRDFATYVVATSAFIIAPPLVQLGISGNAVRRVAELRAKNERTAALAYGRKALAVTTLIGPVGATVIAAFAMITRPANPASVLIALGIALWLESVRTCTSNVLLAHERQSLAALTSYSSRVGATAILLICFLFAGIHTSLAVVMWLIVCIQVVLAVVGLVAVEPFVAKVGNGPPARGMLSEGVPWMIVDCANYVLARADVWVAAAVFVSRTDSASYGAASMMAAQLMLPLGFVAVIVSPIIRSLWVERRLEELDAMLRTVATGATALGVLGAAILSLAAGPILHTVYPASFGRAATAVCVLAVGSVAAVFSGMSSESLIMCVSLRLAAVVNGLWALAGVGLLWLGAYMGGLVGLAVASSASVIGISATQVFIVWRRTHLLTIPTMQLRRRAATLRERNAWGVT